MLEYSHESQNQSGISDDIRNGCENRKNLCIQYMVRYMQIYHTPTYQLQGVNQLHTF